MAAPPAADPALDDVLREVLTGRGAGPDEVEVLARFQQLTGPVMAKGVEDTACYRFTPLTPLCEVGGPLRRCAACGVRRQGRG